MKRIVPEYTIKNRLIFEGFLLGYFIFSIPYIYFKPEAIPVIFFCVGAAIIVVGRILTLLKKDEEN